MRDNRRFQNTIKLEDHFTFWYETLKILTSFYLKIEGDWNWENLRTSLSQKKIFSVSSRYKRPLYIKFKFPNEDHWRKTSSQKIRNTNWSSLLKIIWIIYFKKKINAKFANLLSWGTNFKSLKPKQVFAENSSLEVLFGIFLRL